MVTIDVKSLLICLVLAALVILLVYLIVVAKNLLTTVKHTNKILEDAEVVSEIAANQSKEIDSMITDVRGAVGDISKIISGEQNTIGALSNIAKAVTTLVNMIKNKDK